MTLSAGELEAVAKELEWYASTQLPRQANSIYSHLDRALAVVADDRLGATLALTTPHSSTCSLKGLATIDGPRITRCELTVSLPNHETGKRGRPATFKLVSNTFLPLPQITDALLMCRRALEATHRAQEGEHLIGDGTIDHSSSVSVSAACEDLMRTMRIIESDLLAAKTRLEPSAAQTTAAAICHPASFEPPLPDDLLIEVTVRGSAVRVGVHALDLDYDPQASNVGHENTGAAIITTSRGEQAAICDTAVIDAVVPALADIVKELTGALNVCRMALANLTALRMPLTV
ncbi:hypothetical protein GQ42DRAFT_156962 [Ramicandelaber brevisporus]|nr:hypothetical protein GQ42DRAFT_156962 [Ramicandelaber brevisporus]